MTHEADSELVEESVLREALKPHRPDPHAFREAVERKIAEREKQRAQNDQRIQSVVAKSPLLRRAAAILPPGFLPDSVIATSAGAAAKWGFWKSLPALLAFPATVLAMLLTTFVVGVRSVGALQGRGDLREGTRKALARAEIARWWKKHTAAILLVYGLAFYLIENDRAFELVMGVLVVSMLCLVLLLRELSRANLAARSQVGNLCCRMLFGICAYMWMASHRAIWEPLGWFGVVLLLVGIVAGGVACSALSTSDETGSATGRTWWRQSELYRGVLLLVVLVAGAGVWGFTSHDLFEYAAHLARPGESHPDLPGLATEVGWLRRNGCAEPDLTATRTAFLATLKNDDLRTEDLDAATQLGWLGHDEWESLEPRVIHLQFQNWLEGTGPDHPFTNMDFALRGLVVLGKLTPSDRDRAAQRILSKWPGESQPFNLAAMQDVCASLDIIGCGDLLESRRTNVLRTLGSCWVTYADRFNKGGGFTYAPEVLDRSDTRATEAAVELMMRFGVPKEIDLRRVRTYLLFETQRMLIRDELKLRKLPSGAIALLDLERHLPPPKPSLAEILPSLSILIGCLLLVVFCLYATLRAPTVALAPSMP
jgi:hypothetical protein